MPPPSSVSVTPRLLDALLSPGGAERSSAESALGSIPLEERASSLTSYLLEYGQRGGGGAEASGATAEAAKASLAAVLLRRDASSLGASAAASGESGRSLLKEMAPPLLSLFLGGGSAHAAPPPVGPPAVRRQVGNVIAEICLSLSLLGGTDADEVTGAVLNGIGAEVRIHLNATWADGRRTARNVSARQRAPITGLAQRSRHNPETTNRLRAHACAHTHALSPPLILSDPLCPPSPLWKTKKYCAHQTTSACPPTCRPSDSFPIWPIDLPSRFGGLPDPRLGRPSYPFWREPPAPPPLPLLPPVGEEATASAPPCASRPRRRRWWQWGPPPPSPLGPTGTRRSGS